MTDLWTSASMHAPADVYQERLDAAIDAVSAALAPKFAFVSEATTKASFNDRLDIVARDVEKVVSAVTRRDEALFAPVHEAVISQWEQDFDVIVAARQSESQRTGNKRGWFRKQRRAEKVTKQAVMGDEEDWSGGWARKHDDGRSEQWGTRWIPSDTQRPTEVRLYRGPGNHVRFYDSEGNQHGVEQNNVAPAFAFADSEGWHDPDSIFGGPIGGRDPYLEDLDRQGSRTAKIAMTAAEATNLVAAFPEAVRPRVAAMAELCVYGPGYSRGVTDNLYDALHFAKFESGGDDMEYFLRRAEAQAVVARGGEWLQPMHPRGRPEQSNIFDASLKTAIQSDVCAHCGRPIETIDDEFGDTWVHSDSGLFPCDPSQVDPEALRDDEGDKYDIATPTHTVESMRKGAATWNEKTLTWENWTEDDLAANWVRDFFLARRGHASQREIDTFNPAAQRALQHLIDDDYIIRQEDGSCVWPMQAALGMRKGAPFAGYADFDECVRKNADKGDPNAYCGEIMHRVEDGKTSALRIIAVDGPNSTPEEKARIQELREKGNRGAGRTRAESDELLQLVLKSLTPEARAEYDRQHATSALKPLAFEAALSMIKTTNDPAVLLRMIAGNAKRREELIDVVLEASLNAQDEVARVRLEQLGVSASANDDLVDWDTYIKRINEDRKKTNTDGSPAPAAESEVIDWQDWARQGVLTHSFGSVALTLVREGSLIHWAVTDATGDEQKDAGSEPTVRDALEQAWDVLNKVLDKEPPPSDEIVQEVTDAAQATSDAVENAGGQTPEDAAATDGKPVADPDKAPVHPADPQPNDKKADPALEAKPSAPVDDTKTDPTDVKVDPDTKTADDPNAKPDPNDPTKVTKDPDAPPPDPDAKAADPNAKPADADPTKVDPDKPPSNDAPAQADGDTPAAPDDVVDSAEDKSMGDVLGIEPSTMDTGQTATMTYTLSDGTVGDTNVTFLREDNGIYFFDGPNGEFGLGDRDGEWVDSEGNSFAFSNGDAVEEITGEDDPSNGAQLEDIDLDAPAPAKNDGDSKPDFIKNKESAPADGKAPAKDDKEGDGKKKSQPPWLKTKKSMLEENPWMTDDMAERLAQRSASLAKTLTGAQIVRLRLLSEPCAACGAAPGQPCRTKIGDSLVPVDWTHTR